MKLTKRVLYHTAKPVDFQYPVRNQVLADQMLDFMRLSRGIGLAATQIGQIKKLLVMEVHGKQKICFNPEITGQSEVFTDYDESCLSFPGEQCIISRPDWVAVRYQDAHGFFVNDTLVGLEARCFQHELDHLNGITMWDRHKEQHAN